MCVTDSDSGLLLLLSFVSVFALSVHNGKLGKTARGIEGRGSNPLEGQRPAQTHRYTHNLKEIEDPCGRIARSSQQQQPAITQLLHSASTRPLPSTQPPPPLHLFLTGPFILSAARCSKQTSSESAANEGSRLKPLSSVYCASVCVCLSVCFMGTTASLSLSLSL